MFARPSLLFMLRLYLLCLLIKWGVYLQQQRKQTAAAKPKAPPAGATRLADAARAPRGATTAPAPRQRHDHHHQRKVASNEAAATASCTSPATPVAGVPRALRAARRPLRPH